MRKIAIVGAGQAGLQLGLGLLEKGYQVSMYTNRTAEQVQNGKVMSSQCMFHNALQTERDLALDYWEEQCPAVEGISVTIANPEQKSKVLSWSARLHRYAQSVDQRVKMPVWMQEFERRGGKLVIQDVGLAELEQLSEQYEMVLLAAGKGEIVNQFSRDESRSPFSSPQRALALTYVKGMTAMSPYSRVAFNIIPGVGEYFCFPALTVNGPCEIMVFEGIPNGPMDCWQDVKTPEQHLAKSLEILETFVPWEADRCRNVELTDDGGCLAGRFTPMVRKPVMTLANGKKVFGMADALVVNDPITGQGSNNAAKCSKVYFEAILSRGNQAFDEQWMNDTFEKYWSYAGAVVEWTNSMLRPPEPQMLEAIGAAAGNQQIASKIVNNFDDPRGFKPWWFDEKACQEFIASKQIFNQVA